MPHLSVETKTERVSTTTIFLLHPSAYHKNLFRGIEFKMATIIIMFGKRGYCNTIGCVHLIFGNTHVHKINCTVQWMLE